MRCTRPIYIFARASRNTLRQICKFGAACARATCPYQYPRGRTLPSIFHRGLSTNAPLGNCSDSDRIYRQSWPAQERGISTISVRGKAGVADERDPGEKNEAEKALWEAEADATVKKKDDSKPVAISI